MLLYFILYSIPLYYYLKKDNDAKQKSSLIFTFFLVLIIGLRANSVDRDYQAYVGSYILKARELHEYLQKLSFVNEPAIDIISSFIIRTMGLGYQWVFIAFAAISLFIIRRSMFTINKAEAYTFLLLYCSNYIFLFNFTQIRVGVAIAFFYWSIPDIFNRNKLTYLKKMLLAVMFHYSIVVIFPVYYFYDIKKKDKYIMLICIVAIMIISENLMLFFARYESRILFYYRNGLINITNPLVILRLIIIIMALFNGDKLSKEGEFYLLLYYVGMIIYYIFYASPAIALRLSQIYFSVDIFAIPTLLYRYNKRDKKIVIVLISLILLLSNLYYIKLIAPYAMDVNNLF